MNKVCHLDINPGILCTTDILGGICPCYCGNFPNKSNFPSDLRMTSNFLPGGIMSYVFQIHPKGFYFVATPSYCATAGFFCVKDSDLQVCESVFSLRSLWVLVSLLLFFCCYEDKLNTLAIPILPFNVKILLFAPAS